MRRSLAKKAFQRRETAASGARMTTGSDAIWNIEPKRLEEMNMAGDYENSGGAQDRTEHTKAEKPETMKG